MLTFEAQEKAKKLSHLIDYYEVCNRAAGKSPKTVRWYSENLRLFQRYVRSRHLADSIDSVDARLLREYVLHLQQKNKFEDHPYTPRKSQFLSPATVHAHVRTLRAFFNWLQAEGLFENNLAKALRPPRVPKRIVSMLSDEEIGVILKSFNRRNPSDVRNETIFMILLDTGLRIGELARLTMDDLHLKEGFLKVVGKGSRERIVPIGSNAQKALQGYLFRHRPEPAHPGIESVFLSIHGNPLTNNSMKLMFARLARRSGVSRLHAHLCRHTFATRFLINGGDIFTLQQILGHSTLEMVKHYVNLASSYVAIRHQRFSPLDHLNLR